MEREYSNNYDEYAVKVITMESEQVGYIPKGSAKSKRVFLSLEEGNKVTAKVTERFSFLGDYDNRIYGLRVKVNNLLSSSEAKDVGEEGSCIGIVFLLIFIILIIWLIF